MKAQDIMTQDVYTVQAEDPIWKAAQVMRDANIGAVPVMKGREVVGIITDRDIAIRDVASEEDNRTCSEIMSSNLVSCDPETDIEVAPVVKLCLATLLVVIQRQILKK